MNVMDQHSNNLLSLVLLKTKIPNYYPINFLFNDNTKVSQFEYSMIMLDKYNNKKIYTINLQEGTIVSKWALIHFVKTL